MEIAANSDNQPLNKPKGHKKPLANPFGTINQSFNDSNDFEPLTSPDQPFQNTTYSNRNANSLKTPFPQNSYNNDAEEELEGSISLGAGDNTVTTTSVKPAKSSTQSTNKDSYSVNFSNDFTGFEPGPTQRNTGGSGASGGSVLGSLMGFASLLTSGQPQTGGQAAADYDEENEPPLLEDLGIDLTLIKMRALSVLKFQKCSQEFVAEADMTGPLILFLVLGMLLLLQGKMHFGYLYGFGTLGTLGVYLMMNLLSQETKVHLYNTMSILGYCLFPIVALAFFHVFISLQNFFGLLLSLGAIGWATFAATNFFQVLLSLSEQKWLIAYPIFLFYMVFVLITIF